MIIFTIILKTRVIRVINARGRGEVWDRIFNIRWQNGAAVETYTRAGRVGIYNT